MQKAVFLDRDGVINRTTVRNGTPYPPQSVAEVEILPGVAEALALLEQHGFLLVVVTNQPDVARGTQTREAVEQINQLLCEQLPLHAVYTCYHDNADNCDCRKPQPGLLLQAASTYAIALAESCMVGDRWSDIAAGAAAGCLTFLLDVPYNQCQRCTPDVVVPDLLAAAQWIINAQQSAESI